MRILGQIPHPDLLISVFKSSNKFILKIEAGPFEQTYKFIENDNINKFEDIQKMINEDLIAEIYNVFDKMNVQYNSILSKLN